jgi:hypothetical protein
LYRQKLLNRVNTQLKEKVEENIIYDEEEEVLEMYFILTGTIGVGYHMYQQPL